MLNYTRQYNVFCVKALVSHLVIC